MTSQQFSNEQEFDAKLTEIGNCYETIKDAIYAMGGFANRYEFDRAYENLVRLRDIAATSLRANYEIKDN